MIKVKESEDYKKNERILQLLKIPPEERDNKVLLELMSFTKNFKIFDTIGMTSEHSLICKDMNLAYFKPNENIVKQEDKGDSFFYILSGIVKVVITKNYDLGDEQGQISIDKYICDLHAGQTFGELSLIYGTERSATITSVTNSTLIKIDKNSFDYYVKDIFDNQLKDEIDFMKICPLFHRISKDFLIKLAIRTEIIKFSTNKTILDINNISNNIYLIRRGNVKVIKKIKFIKCDSEIRKIEISKHNLIKVKKPSNENQLLYVQESIDEYKNNNNLKISLDSKYSKIKKTSNNIINSKNRINISNTILNQNKKFKVNNYNNYKYLTMNDRNNIKEKIEENINSILIKGPSEQDILNNNYYEQDVNLEILKIGDIFPTYYASNNISLDARFIAETPCELIVIKFNDLVDIIPEAYEFMKLYSKPYPNEEFLRKYHLYNNKWKSYRKAVKNNIHAECFNRNMYVFY